MSIESGSPEITQLSPESRRLMVNALEGMLVGTGFVRFNDKNSPTFGPKTLTLDQYLADEEISFELQSLYNNRELFIRSDPASGVASYRKGLVTKDSRVFELCLKDIGQEDYIVQVAEKTYTEDTAIEVLSGVLDGVAFGTTRLEQHGEEKPTPIVDFSINSKAMEDLLEIPNFREEIAFLTQEEKNKVKNTPSNVVVYSKQVIAENGNIYDIKAKQVGDRYLYTVNEVVQDIDSMTGLGTKYAVKRKLREIEATMARDRDHGRVTSMSVMFVDLDDFKLFNDQYSHRVGDEAIIEAGRILRASARESDLVARISGDEFMIILEDAGVGTSALVRRRIMENVANANKGKPDIGRHIRFSLGVASEDDPLLRRYLEFEEGLTPEMVEMIADQKMYVEKKSKKIVKELRKRIRSGAYKSFDYVPITEEVFGLNKVDAWRSRQDYVANVVNILYTDGLFGEVVEGDNGAAKSTRDDLIKALFFQDLLTYSKEEDFSLIASEFVRDEKKAEAKKNNQKLRPVNDIHPQLASEFVLRLGDMDVEIPDFDVDRIAKLVEYQHAWVDGSHSPVEANIFNIPNDAQWLSLINSFVLVLKNEYGERKSPEEAYAEIERGKGTKFNPDMADMFIATMKQFYINVESGKYFDFIEPLAQ